MKPLDEGRFAVTPSTAKYPSQQLVALLRRARHHAVGSRPSRSRRRLRSALSFLLAAALTINPLLGTVALSDETAPVQTSSSQAAPSTSGSSGTSDTGSTGSGTTSTGSTGGTASTAGTGSTGGTTSSTTSGSGSTSPSGSTGSDSTAPSGGTTSSGSTTGGSTGTTASGSTGGTTASTGSTGGTTSSAPTADQSTTQSSTTSNTAPGGTTGSTNTSAGTTSTGTNPTAGTSSGATTSGTASTTSTGASTPAPAAATAGTTAAPAADPTTAPASSTQTTTGTSSAAVQNQAASTSTTVATQPPTTAAGTSATATTGTTQATTEGTPSPAAAPATAGTAAPATAEGTATAPTTGATAAATASPSAEGLAAQALAGNQPTVGSQSGDALAQTGQSQATELNLQVSSGTTAGGSGSVSVTNQASTTLDRSGQASAESGIAIALTPVPTPSPAVSASASGSPVAEPNPLTLASSGGASATGLQSQNVVVNSSQASVQVGGSNSGAITLQSSNRLEIVEGAQADARTGNTLAAPAGLPSPGITQVPTPVVPTGAPATSAPATSVGLQAQNQVVLTAVATAAPSATGTITIQQQAQGVIQNVGMGVAVSGPALASPAPSPTKVAPLAESTPVPAATTPTVATTATTIATTAAQTPTPSAKADSVASSGSAQATGLQAQNVVTTSADVNVKVKGENKGLITVLIETITQIFNFGWAGASSGSAVAANGGSAAASGSPGPSAVPSPVRAASGDAQATGAKVDNQIDVSGSASVKVNGDNHNPINIFMDMFAWIGNLGIGWAQSGNAVASGGSGTDPGASGATMARSGSAQAVGLDATNRVNMSASANVDIEGSNYADIYVRVRFYSYIWNEGAAYAGSGSVQSTGGAAGSGSAAGSLASTPSNGPAGTGFSSSVARSGDATAEGHNSSVQIASAQYANGNGSGSGFDAQLPTIINQLPQPRSLGGSPTPASGLTLADAVGDVHAQSGNASSFGFQTGDAVLNAQVAHASNPGSDRASATNSFEFSSTMRGDSKAESGFAGVNATPVPTPTPQIQREGGQAAEGHSAGGYYESRLEYYQTTWAGGNSLGGKLFSSTVRVNVFPRWPDLEQPPMPEPQMPRVASVAPAPASGWASRVWSAAASGAASLVNPLVEWPRLEAPPMPSQALPQGSGPQFGAPGNLRGPLEALIWSLLGMLALGAVATRRGRAWMTMWAQAGLRQARATARLIMGLIMNL